MAHVNDIAQKLYDDLGFIGAMRQQKLAYFIQAWSLAWTGRPAFAQRIEAWPNGPVVQELWRDNRYGLQAPEKIAGADAARLQPDEISIVDAVVAHYNGLSTDGLKELSHDEAWLEARVGLAPTQSSNREMPLRSVARYYSRQAILNPDVPRKPELVPCGLAPADVIREESQRQMALWRGTLERLASA